MSRERQPTDSMIERIARLLLTEIYHVTAPDDIWLGESNDPRAVHACQLANLVIAEVAGQL